jgi:DMSO/TMAO reductase YedYZ molybdopterin-dependent catalytic subunit
MTSPDWMRASAAGSLDRRRFLSLAGGAAALALVAACDSRGPASARQLLRYAERENEGVERWLFRHANMDHARASAMDAGASFPGYYIARSVPIWDVASRGPWTLEVSGAVRRPLRLGLDDLLSLPRVSQRVNHYCVEGWTAVATWTGVRMQELALLAHAMPAARYVDFQSFDDGYHESWDLESATHPQTLIAYGFDGQLLGPNHGAPARLHSPVKLGYKNTKYLTKVVFMTERNGGYWSDQGYEWFGGT